MNLTPTQSFDQIKDAIVGYLETAYKISNPDVFAERATIMRKRGTVAQSPFVESTPSFPSAHMLVDLERQYPDILPQGLAQLVQHGVPVDRFPLWLHQEKALLAAFTEQPNLLVATGTGSGKTESFLLPILADILTEARTWKNPLFAARPGEFSSQANQWLHSRRHEERPAALRAIILYPMNALVNDQLSRLRRILSRAESPQWQQANLQGNAIHFGMYTGLTQRAGSWKDKWRRNEVAEYLRDVQEDWEQLGPTLQLTGSWPRPNSPEMLVRWDMQAAPPDILVTNYSMLEYMLVRPIEESIFRITRTWLERTPNARFTLVLDEAHTYTGAKGTEVAHLVRRLKERLGISQDSPKFRAIATTASLPTDKASSVKEFVAGLFGESQDRFTLIELESSKQQTNTHDPTEQSLRAFAEFQRQFTLSDPNPAIEQLATNLGLEAPDRKEHPQVALHKLLQNQKDVKWIRQRTARKATLIDVLAEEAWSGLGTVEDRELATSGVLAAGSYARAEALADTPPLISMRLHAFFRGLPGIWACMNPDCSAVDGRFRTASRPIGKLYTSPRPWCECGSRVLELFSCRRCGLLFLGGIPDEIEHSLWPWSDDLSGERQDSHDFRIFGVERPHEHYHQDHRSTKTTLPCHPNDPFARVVYELDLDGEGESEGSPFPQKCPRCSNYRAPGREIVEDLRTKGPQSLAMVVEEAYRVQPRAADGTMPNYGRKALIFADSRMEAAQLAGDLRQIHHSDLFRQLLYRALYSCGTCDGTGSISKFTPVLIGEEPQEIRAICPDCGGTGEQNSLEPLKFSALRDRVLSIQFERGIDPTNGTIADYFRRLSSGDQTVYDQAAIAFNVALRRELAENEFGLEPLGLASWKIQLPEKTGNFVALTQDESKTLIRILARILASENILLPPQPLEPWQWPNDQVKPYERSVMIRASGRRQAYTSVVPFNLKHTRKLGRYINAIADQLLREGRLRSDAEKAAWLDQMNNQIWNALSPQQFGVMTEAGAQIEGQVPRGIRIDAFELHPISGFVERCASCGYIASETLLHVCQRCGQTTVSARTDELTNFYRRSAKFALPNSGHDDPYPLRAIEHTAQIALREARNEERWFQNLFREDQDPQDHRIDVLSVTTTMEMGIDIGSLLTVGLRNVPPTVANYQQRAGRAGRRGSSIATVLTYCQFRSHDQYYFDRPPEIVSDPPRVPTLYLNNEVIARRHVRSLVLQEFFSSTPQVVAARNRGLFQAWGSVGDFSNRGTADLLRRFISTNKAPLIQRSRKIVHSSFGQSLGSWLDALVAELQEAVNRSDVKKDLLEVLVNVGLLPKYAFPVDVVGLSMPSMSSFNSDEEGNGFEDRMQRDLKIALAEYAPGAEVIKGAFPNTFIYKVAGIYDPFEKSPNYSPTGFMVECMDCQAVDLRDSDTAVTCTECGSHNLVTLPYLKPQGFTVDQARPDAGRERYELGGRERAGFVTPVRLLVGETSFLTGKPQVPFAPNLYSHIRIGNLFVANKGPDRQFPGFTICPDCGRHFSDDIDAGPHAYPANVPPQFGRLRGPRAGNSCPNKNHFENRLVLGHEFRSEVILLGVDLPETLDAPFLEPSGQAVWYSFGTLIKNAATVVLQVNPEEIAVGVRPVRRGANRIHGEVFLYDDVPGGAGYARAIAENLQTILIKALELGEECPNPDCSGACYHCLFDYRNQYLHPLLDRSLGTAVIKYLLFNDYPEMDVKAVERSTTTLEAYAGDVWKISPDLNIDGRQFVRVLQRKGGPRFGIHLIHPMMTRPSKAEDLAIMGMSGIESKTFTTFDVDRRPFWVLNALVQ